MNQPGLNYLVLAVQFADGTSGILWCSGCGRNWFKITGRGLFLDFQLDEGATFRVMDTSSVGNIQSDTPFLSIASNIICSELNNNGFQVCQQGVTPAPNIGMVQPGVPTTNLFSDSDDDDDDGDDGGNDDGAEEEAAEEEEAADDESVDFGPDGPVD